jgi:hypothetical protein
MNIMERVARRELSTEEATTLHLAGRRRTTVEVHNAVAAWMLALLAGALTGYTLTEVLR